MEDFEFQLDLPGDQYYQASKSRTKFRPVTIDKEEIPLADMRKTEKSAILDLPNSDRNILVMGGMSSTSKSYILEQLRNEHNIPWIDLMGEFEKNTKDELTRNPKLVMFDEGMLLSLDPKVRSKFLPILYELLEKDIKIIIAGGGNSHTSQEQTDLIAELLPKDVKVQSLPFEFKLTNQIQTKELIQHCLKEIDRVHHDLSYLLKDENLKLMAMAYLPYFRFPRSIVLTSSYFLEKNSATGINNEEFMLEHIVDQIIELQYELWNKVVNILHSK